MMKLLIAIVKPTVCGEIIFYQCHPRMLKLACPSVSVSGVNGFTRLDRWVSILFYRATKQLLSMCSLWAYWLFL